MRIKRQTHNEGLKQHTGSWTVLRYLGEGENPTSLASERRISQALKENKTLILVGQTVCGKVIQLPATGGDALTITVIPKANNKIRETKS
ncbi:hypothetical protein L1987_23112 [Smallanthus sonchifolius]|uniref:Uncharacterized protein n=1 Tax=Smallanthus sonchifolius TaxID=185202 RepID=A0ACB9IGJ3_9ASTR|nr:hypothetical protein L1987_23112 [Smallanthus sonchifolius]